MSDNLFDSCEVLGSFGRNVKTGDCMLKNYLKTSVRGMKKRPLFSLITVIGMAISLAAFTMIMLYVVSELGTDNVHENYADIYRLEGSSWFNVPAPVLPLVRQMMPGLQAACLIDQRPLEVSWNNEFFSLQNAVFSDAAFDDVFTLQMLQGSADEALNEPRKIVISQSKARVIFGAENPVGKTVKLGEEMQLTVTGVFKDYPQNVHLPIDALGSMKTTQQINDQDDYFDNWSNWNYLLYMHMTPNTNLTDAADVFYQEINAFMEREFDGERGAPRFGFRHIKDVYFYDNLEKSDGCRHGNRMYVQMFIVAAILILLIAIINYINIATARAGLRAREIGVRKTVGALRQQITAQFLVEALMITTIASVLGVILLELLLPSFSNLMQRELHFRVWQSPLQALWLVGGIVVVSLLAGIYPALFLAGRKTTGILKNQIVHGRSGLRFRRILITLQMVVTVGLILASLIITRQMLFMVHNDMGFDRGHILYFYLNRDLNEHLDTLKEQLRAVPEIDRVSQVHSVVTSGRMQWGRNLSDGTHVNYFSIPCDEEYIPLMGLKLVEGTNFKPEHASGNGAMIINEAFVREYGLENPMEMGLSEGTPIIGVIKDFSFQTLHHAVQPMALHYPPVWSWMILVKAQPGGLEQARKSVENVCGEFTDKPVYAQFLDDLIESRYWREKQFGKLFSIFSGLAIMLSAMGILGLVSFEAERRIKEIGIRKTLGASSAEILLLFGRELLTLVGIGSVIAWVVVTWAMNYWLQDFAQRQGVHWSLYVISAGVTLLIAACTYGGHAWRASRANPAEALNYE
jgi:putative ABC transport system permease protein